jgi:hypothetical protein
LSLLKDCPPDLMGTGTGTDAAAKNYKIVYTSRREVYEVASTTPETPFLIIFPFTPSEVVTDALATGAGGGASAASGGSAWVEVRHLLIYRLRPL